MLGLAAVVLDGLVLAGRVGAAGLNDSALVLGVTSGVHSVAHVPILEASNQVVKVFDSVHVSALDSV